MDFNRRRITAFGSSRIAAKEPRYADVQLLSSKLARAGWDGMTGGHQGMMAAFSQGMRQGGGHVRGVTLERFPTPPDNTLSEEIRAKDFFERMQVLIEAADAYLVLPGGLGTLAELAMSWDLLAINVLEPRPLILYGEMWKEIHDHLHSNLVMSVDHGFELMQICESHDDVLTALNCALN
ncbi:MAG: LOG family protein [Mariprofundaceae bacterium]|nr:LOG family protein [Mariprofundaceae bacterium]